MLDYCDVEALFEVWMEAMSVVVGIRNLFVLHTFI